MILANSRPYEGFILGVIVIGLFLFRTRRLRQLVPAALLFAGGLMGTLYYFYRVTGSPLRMPSDLYGDQYAIVPLFVWQNLRPEPVFHNGAVRDAMRSCTADYERYGSVTGVVRTEAWKVASAANFFLGPLVVLPLLMLPWIIRSRKLRPLVLCCAGVFAGNAAVIPFEIHYAAPIACAVVALNTYCLRLLWIARRYGNPIGDYLVPAAPVMVLAMCIHSIVGPKLKSSLEERSATEARLRGLGGKHLVIVRYGNTHSPANEWVFNGPEIDSENVVWARDQGERNDELIRYYGDRAVWIAEADRQPATVVPVTGPTR